MKKKLLTLLVVSVAALGANAQSIPGEWSTRYQTVMDSITSNFQSEDGEPIGISIAVNVPGIGTWKGASGMAAPDVPMTADMTTGVASTGKLFTSVILLKLQEANLLSLDDEIGQYITEDLHDIDETATIRQLLTQETGFFDYSNDRLDEYYEDVLADLDRYWTIPEVLDRIHEPHFAVGTGYRYSNTNYILAAWIIEEVTNMSYSEALHQYITGPLNLNRTFDGHESGSLDGTAEASSYFSGIWYPRIGFTSFYSQDLGAGRTVATPEDMASFYQAVFGGTFLSPESKQQLLAFDAASLYGLGVWHSYSQTMQRDIYTHSGMIAGFYSEAIYDPMTGASIFWITNHDHANFSDNSLAIRREFRKGYPEQLNDAGIERIVNPRSTVCIGSVSPVVIIKNYGIATLTSAIVKYQLNNNANIFTYNWTGSLATGATVQVTLPAIPLNQSNNHTLRVWTQSPNGNTEGYIFNDQKTAVFAARPDGAELTSFSEDFESEATAIKMWNPNHISAYQWGISKLSGSSGSHSLATLCNDFPAVGDESIADLPLIALNGSNELTFKYAYAYWEGYENRLQVLLSDDCGATWNTLFDRSGSELAQGLELEGELYFANDDEWHTETLSLDEYTGSDVQIRFKRIMETEGGNNLFVDDIHIGASLGTADFFKDNVKVYPNPASDKVTVTGLPHDTVITLYNMSGQKLLEVAANGDTAIDISGLAKGMYFLNTAKGSAKIIKK